MIFPRTLAIVALLTHPALSQPIEPVDPQERAIHLDDPGERTQEQTIRAVMDRINAAFLTDEERATLRVLHGQWLREDLNDPILASQVALDIHDYANPIFSDGNAPLLDRAQAQLAQGNPAEALSLIEQIETPTIVAYAIKADALQLLGRTDEAIETLERIEQSLAAQTIEDAGQLAIGSEALITLTRLRSPEVSAKADYEAIEALLSMARDRLDRLDWRVRNVEAHLLYEHHNLGEAHTAAIEALRLNPRAADPMLLLGHIAVDGFDFNNAERLADTLDLLASGFEEISEDNLPQVSIGGAILRARIALRRRDPEGAEMALDPALDRFPTHPTLLALQASASAAGYRMSSTNRLLTKYDEKFPNSPTAAVWVGKTLSESRQYTYAAEVLRRAIERAPNWGEPRLQLGLMLVQAGKDEHAREALTEAIKLDPFNIRAQNSLRLLTELATYEVIETDHFIIRYKAGDDEVLAQEMPGILEAIHTRVCSDQPGGMNHEPGEKTIIELMPNHEWFAVRIGGMPSIHTMAASTGPVIAFESPREGPKSKVGHYDWARVLQHEYTHTVNLSRTRNRVIHWMTEANAVFNEDAPRDMNQWSLLTNAFRSDDLFDLDSINIAFVRPEKPSDRSLAYAQGAWMFEFIVDRFGPQTPRDIMDASATGRSAPEAFQQVLNLSQSEFMSAFMEWAKQDLLSRGLIPPDDLPSINDLLGDVDAGFPPLATLDKLLEEYPDHTDLMTLRLGIAMALQGDRLSDEQLALLKNAILVRPEDEMPHKRLARHYLASDNTDDHTLAILHLEYLDVREVHTTAYANELAELYAQVGQYDRAFDKAIRATRIAPFDAPTREQAARMAILIKNYDNAQHQLETLMDIEPDREIHKQRLEALLSMREN